MNKKECGVSYSFNDPLNTSSWAYPSNTPVTTPTGTKPYSTPITNVTPTSTPASDSSVIASSSLSRNTTYSATAPSTTNGTPAYSVSGTPTGTPITTTTGTPTFDITSPTATMDNTLYSFSSLKNVYKLNDEQIAKYFVEIKNKDGSISGYKLNDKKGYYEINSVLSKIFTEYKNALILNNLLKDKNKTTNSASGLNSLNNNKSLTQTNYRTYIEQINGCNSKEEADSLRKQALNKFIKDFSEGNLAYAQVSTILSAIGVSNKQIKSINGNYVISFKFDGKSYSITCNKSAASKGTDDITSKTINSSILQIYPQEILDKYFIAAVTKDGNVEQYAFKDSSLTFEDFKEKVSSDIVKSFMDSEFYGDLNTLYEYQCVVGNEDATIIPELTRILEENSDILLEKDKKMLNFWLNDVVRYTILYDAKSKDCKNELVPQYAQKEIINSLYEGFEKGYLWNFQIEQSLLCKDICNLPQKLIDILEQLAGKSDNELKEFCRNEENEWVAFELKTYIDGGKYILYSSDEEWTNPDCAKQKNKEICNYLTIKYPDFITGIEACLDYDQRNKIINLLANLSNRYAEMNNNEGIEKVNDFFSIINNFVEQIQNYIGTIGIENLISACDKINNLCINNQSDINNAMLAATKLIQKYDNQEDIDALINSSSFSIILSAASKSNNPEAIVNSVIEYASNIDAPAGNLLYGYDIYTLFHQSNEIKLISDEIADYNIKEQYVQTYGDINNLDASLSLLNQLDAILAKHGYSIDKQNGIYDALAMTILDTQEISNGEFLVDKITFLNELDEYLSEYKPDSNNILEKINLYIYNNTQKYEINSNYKVTVYIQDAGTNEYHAVKEIYMYDDTLLNYTEDYLKYQQIINKNDYMSIDGHIGKLCFGQYDAIPAELQVYYSYPELSNLADNYEYLKSMNTATAEATGIKKFIEFLKEDGAVEKFISNLGKNLLYSDKTFTYENFLEIYKDAYGLESDEDLNYSHILFSGEIFNRLTILFADSEDEETLARWQENNKNVSFCELFSIFRPAAQTKSMIRQGEPSANSNINDEFNSVLQSIILGRKNENGEFNNKTIGKFISRNVSAAGNVYKALGGEVVTKWFGNTMTKEELEHLASCGIEYAINTYMTAENLDKLTSNYININWDDETKQNVIDLYKNWGTTSFKGKVQGFYDIIGGNKGDNALEVMQTLLHAFGKTGSYISSDVENYMGIAENLLAGFNKGTYTKQGLNGYETLVRDLAQTFGTENHQAIVNHLCNLLNATVNKDGKVIAGEILNSASLLVGGEIGSYIGSAARLYQIVASSGKKDIRDITNCLTDILQQYAPGIIGDVASIANTIYQGFLTDANGNSKYINKENPLGGITSLLHDITQAVDKDKLMYVDSVCNFLNAVQSKDTNNIVNASMDLIETAGTFMSDDVSMYIGTAANLIRGFTIKDIDGNTRYATGDTTTNITNVMRDLSAISSTFQNYADINDICDFIMAIKYKDPISAVESALSMIKTAGSFIKAAWPIEIAAGLGELYCECAKIMHNTYLTPEQKGKAVCDIIADKLVNYLNPINWLTSLPMFKWLSKIPMLDKLNGLIAKGISALLKLCGIAKLVEKIAERREERAQLKVLKEKLKNLEREDISEWNMPLVTTPNIDTTAITNALLLNKSPDSEDSYDENNNSNNVPNFYNKNYYDYDWYTKHYDTSTSVGDRITLDEMAQIMFDKPYSELSDNQKEQIDGAMMNELIVTGTTTYEISSKTPGSRTNTYTGVGGGGDNSSNTLDLSDIEYMDSSKLTRCEVEPAEIHSSKVNSLINYMNAFITMGDSADTAFENAVKMVSLGLDFSKMNSEQITAIQHAVRIGAIERNTYSNEISYNIEAICNDFWGKNYSSYETWSENESHDANGNLTGSNRAIEAYYNAETQHYRDTIAILQGEDSRTINNYNNLADHEDEMLQHIDDPPPETTSPYINLQLLEEPMPDMVPVNVGGVLYFRVNINGVYYYKSGASGIVYVENGTSMGGLLL